MPQWSWGLVTAILILACLMVSGRDAQGGESLLEDLQYRVDVMMWQDAARARITLKSLGPGRYQAELLGEPQGMLKKCTGERRENYRTEMICRQGRLMPLVYREESIRKGTRHLKEYRFDYDKGQVEMWLWKEGKGLVPKWQASLTEPFYDPLSAFYNCRLGAMGPLKEGESIKVTGIPYPKREEFEVRIGPDTEDGRKAMVTIINESFANSRGVVFAYLGTQRVPKQAWTRVLRFGRVTGELLADSKILQGSLPGVSAPETQPAPARP